MLSKMTPAVLAALLLTSSVSSFAATVNDQGAAELKKNVEDSLSFPMDMAKHNGQGLTLTGAVEVTPKGEYYEVKLPGAAFTGVEGLKFDLGTIITNVTPGDNGEYTTALSLPQTMTAYGEDNKAIATITIGDQKFTGTWWPALAAFTKIDSDYKNIQVKSAGTEDFNGSIAELKTTMDLTKNADDTWSGPNNFAATNVKLHFGEHGGADLSVDTVVAAATTDKMNLKARKDMQDKVIANLKDFANKPAAPLAPGQAAPASPTLDPALVANMMQSVQGFVDGMTSKFQIAGVKIHVNGEATAGTPAANGMPAVPASPAIPFDANLSSLTSGFEVTGLQADKGNTHAQVKLDGLDIKGADPVIAGLIPTQAAFEIDLQHLPMKSISTAFGDVLTDVISNAATQTAVPNAGAQLQAQHHMQMEVMSLMQTLPQALVAAGSTLTIKNTHTDAPDLQSALEGEFHANAASPVHAEGSTTLSLTGVDELILKLQAAGQAPNANPKFAGYATMLSMLQVYTQPEKTVTGKSVRKLKFELTPQGQALLNGQPLGMPGVMPPGDMAPGMTSPGMPAPDAPSPATP